MNYPVAKNNTDTSEEALSIVYQPSLNDADEILAETSFYTEIPPKTQAPIWWEELATPWTMAALLLLLGSNSLLSLAQGLKTQKAEQPATVLAVPPPIITRSSTLSLHNLSQIARSARPIPKATIVPPQPVAMQSIPKPPKRNLTQALLPVAAQPQWMPVTPAPVTPATVVQQPIKPLLVQAPPSPSPSISPNLLKERLLEEIRERELPPPPLGFNHKTRARLQSAATQQNPASLIQQMQQQQQQKVPSSIIIDSQRTQVNY